MKHLVYCQKHVKKVEPLVRCEIVLHRLVLGEVHNWTKRVTTLIDLPQLSSYGALVTWTRLLCGGGGGAIIITRTEFNFCTETGLS